MPLPNVYVNYLKEPEKTKRPQKEGSTHLPKIPVVKLRKPPISTRKGIIDWADVATLRKELKEKVYRDDQLKRYRSDYIRTSQDFYRMDLDKLRQGNPKTLDNMKVCCNVYLGTSMGSRKAIKDIIRVLRPDTRADEKPTTEPQTTQRGAEEESKPDPEPEPDEKQPDPEPEPEPTTDDAEGE